MRSYERASEKGTDAIMAGSWKMRLSPLARCILILKFDSTPDIQGRSRMR
jgi:hypothetical protein